MKPQKSIASKFFVIILSAYFMQGCNSCPVNGQNLTDYHTPSNVTVETFVTGLEVPWSLEFANDGRLFITERPGRIRVVENGRLQSEPLAVLKDVTTISETGLMGLALHPDFVKNQLLYVCYTTTKSDQLIVRIKRMRLIKTGIAEETVILDDIPGAQIHVGCRLKFGPDQKLYVTTGDASKRELAQKLSSLAGKTLRINDDGSAPMDNPFVNTPGARKEIWSFGHRNAQGMDFQPVTGLMLQTEHGPSGFDGPGGGDEVNIVERGQNLGWPIVHHDKTKAHMISPLLEFTPAVAPAGATFYRSNKYPDWTNNFFFACLRGKSLIRVALDKRKVVKQERLLSDRFGRIRDVVVGPDGAIYFATSNRDGRGNPTKDDDRIMRMTGVAK